MMIKEYLEDQKAENSYEGKYPYVSIDVKRDNEVEINHSDELVLIYERSNCAKKCHLSLTLTHPEKDATCFEISLFYSFEGREKGIYYFFANNEI